MSLSEQERMQIAEVVYTVLDDRLSAMTKEIIAGFIEALDWHNDNFAKIMEQTNNKTLNFLEKKKREVIEVRSKDYVESAMARQAVRDKEAEISSRVGFVPKSEPPEPDTEGR